MLHSRLFDPGFHGYRTVLSEFYSVGEKIHADLLDALLVTEDEFLWELSYDLDFLACGLHLDHPHYLHDALLDLHVDGLHLECATLDLGMV